MDVDLGKFVTKIPALLTRVGSVFGCLGVLALTVKVNFGTAHERARETR